LAGALLLAMAVTAVCGAARSEPHDVRLLGAGATSCSAWTEARRGSDPSSEQLAADYTEWVEGYVSAMEQELPEIIPQVRNADVVGLRAWVDNYCAAHPLDDLAVAANALVSMLQTNAQ
jgi:hypothetical protein